MKLLASMLLIGLAACSSAGSSKSHYPEAQAIVDRVSARHPDLVRLTVHAVPSDQKESRVIASNVPAKLYDMSDPEDLQAMSTKQSVTLKEGDRLDHTVPVVDASGRAIAAVGVTVQGSSEASMRKIAEEIARETTSAILAAKKPLW